MQIRILNGEAVRRLLVPEACFGLMEAAFRQVARKEAVQPLRQVLRPPEGPTMFGVMWGLTQRPPRFGAKILSVTAGGAGGSHHGFVMLIDAQSGAPRAIVDASEITAIRTAAATAVATAVLGRPDAKTLGLFGTGEQARHHIRALAARHTYERILVWGRDVEKARAFAAEEAAHLGIAVEAVSRPDETAGADVLCAVTSAPEPFLQRDWLRPGQHINLVGSSIPTTSEAEAEFIVPTRYFADNVESALAQAGELRRALAQGLVTERHILGTIGDVLEGTVAGRNDARDITLFKSLGMIGEDILAADLVLSEAEKQDCGTVIDW